MQGGRVMDGSFDEWVESGCPPNAKDVDLSEDGVASYFTAVYGDKLRFDHDQGRWFEWTGDRWKLDNTHLAFSYCRDVSRKVSEKLKPNQKAPMRKAAFAAGVERLARSDRAHAVTQDAWDQDPWLLGCPNGVVDLKTGKFKKPDPKQGITKHAAAGPSDKGCPTWLRFLSEATAGDQAMVEFLQRWCGYCLTGNTREHALIFLYGPGGNGKTVFLNTIDRIMGDYATTAAMDTFTSSRGDKHPTELALLKGARLVSSSETEEGRAWAESRIKQMTGGDPISARFMRQDFFTYIPQFKLTIVGNHAPALANVDEAARRRFNIVPFTVKPENPDLELEVKLEKEWSAILKWMIDGCIAWQEGGLQRPESVVAATEQYFAGQDLTAQWMEECTRVETGNEHLFETSADLFKSWSDFAKSNGEEVGTSKGLGPKLRRHGLRAKAKKIGNKTYRGWVGIELPLKTSGAQYND
jgi:putative DNA primase/helicase